MNRPLVSAGMRSAGVTIRHVCSVDMLKTARVLANVGSDCGSRDVVSMEIRGAWGSVRYGLQCMACEMWDCGLCGFL